MRARRLVALTGLFVLAGFLADTGSASAAMVGGHANKHHPKPSSSPSPSTQPQYPTYTSGDQNQQGGNGGKHGNKHHKASTPTTTRTPKTAPKPAVRPASSPSAVSRGIPHSDYAYRAPSSPPVHHAVTTTTSTAPIAPAAHRPDVANDHGAAGLLSAAFSNGVPKDGAFPAGLLIAAVVFLALQGRMDRSDAKLSLAEVASDDGLEFGAPPSMRRDRATV